MPRHTLFQAALDADEAYTESIRRMYPTRDRWTITREEHKHHDISSAYDAKVLADRCWIEWLRNAGFADSWHQQRAARQSRDV